MKTILATIATIFVGLVALPEKVEARPHSGHVGHSYTYCSGHASCGCATYTRRVIASYDCYNRPIYRYYSVPTLHSCRSSHHGHHGSRYTPRYNNHRYDAHRGHSSHRGHSRGITIRGPLGNIRIGR